MRKFLSLLFAVALVICSVGITAYAQEKEYLVTVLCIPDFETDESTEITLRLIKHDCSVSQWVYLYPENNFVEKFYLEEGDYTLTLPTVKNDYGHIYSADQTQFTVSGTSDIVFHLQRSEYIDLTSMYYEEESFVGPDGYVDLSEYETDASGNYITTTTESTTKTATSVTGDTEEAESKLYDPFGNEITTNEEAETTQSQENEEQDKMSPAKLIILGVLFLILAVMMLTVLKFKKKHNE